jgi:hypothetical protein
MDFKNRLGGALFEQVQLAQDVVQQGVLRNTVLSLLVA